MLDLQRISQETGRGVTMKRFVLFGPAVVFALIGAATQASAATIYSQSNILRGPDTALNCSGGSHGKCTISEIAPVGTSSTANNDIRVSCSLKKANPNTNYSVFWVCTNTARGCHDQVCGSRLLGTLATGATGAGKFTTVIGNNPFPEKYVHFDLTGNGGPFTAVYAGIPIGTGPVLAPLSTTTGDPTQQ
jgi:hypothetical protein